MLAQFLRPTASDTRNTTPLMLAAKVAERDPETVLRQAGVAVERGGAAGTRLDTPHISQALPHAVLLIRPPHIKLKQSSTTLLWYLSRACQGRRDLGRVRWSPARCASPIRSRGRRPAWTAGTRSATTAGGSTSKPRSGKGKRAQYGAWGWPAHPWQHSWVRGGCWGGGGRGVPCPRQPHGCSGGGRRQRFILTLQTSCHVHYPIEVARLFHASLQLHLSSPPAAVSVNCLRMQGDGSWTPCRPCQPHRLSFGVVQL